VPPTCADRNTKQRDGRAYKRWPEILNSDSKLTSALLDLLLHHAEIIAINGPSYRGKNHAEPHE
jgi:DNA replication protein DnaC